MPCTRCPHCRALANPAALRLDGPPSSSPTAGTDLAFYRSFGLAYDRARELKVQPRTALMAANPWMTASQCTAYLKRARALGMVQTPRRQQATAAPVFQLTAPTVVREADAVAVSAPRATSKRSRRAGVTGWTPEQSDAVFFNEDVQRRFTNSDRTGRPVTAEQVRAAYPERISEAQAQATLDWALAAGYVVRADGEDGVFSADLDDQPATGRAVVSDWLANLRAARLPVFPDVLVNAGVFPDESSARAELDRLASDGAGEWTRAGWLATP